MQILVVLIAVITSTATYAFPRSGGIYHGYQNDSVCRFDISPNFSNLTFQVQGDRVQMGMDGVTIAPNKVRFESTVYFDYSTSSYVRYEPHYAGAQYKFTVILEWNSYGRLNASVVREKVSGFLPGFTKTSYCEDIDLQQSYRNLKDPLSCAAHIQ